jgi:hypothetical protein
LRVSDRPTGVSTMLSLTSTSSGLSFFPSQVTSREAALEAPSPNPTNPPHPPSTAVGVTGVGGGSHTWPPRWQVRAERPDGPIRTEADVNLGGEGGKQAAARGLGGALRRMAEATEARSCSEGEAAGSAKMG